MTTGPRLLQDNSFGAGVAEAGDRFGYTLAAGRLDDGNLFADLAIGSPFEDHGGWTDAGVVHLAFGGASGVSSGRAAQYIGEYEGFEIGDPLGDDHFGHLLAIGDLGDDGWGDLVVGVPTREAQHRGAVQVLYGALIADGFESSGTSWWSPRGESGAASRRRRPPHRLPRTPGGARVSHQFQRNPPGSSRRVRHDAGIPLEGEP